MSRYKSNADRLAFSLFLLAYVFFKQAVSFEHIGCPINNPGKLPKISANIFVNKSFAFF